MSNGRHYYINNDGKTVTHFEEKQSNPPQSHEYAGFSQLPIRGAAGFYTNNRAGYDIINGDEVVEAPSSEEE